MRKLFTLCLLVFSLSASAQWQQTGAKVRYVNGLGIPTRDTAAGVAADSSQILIRPADSALYVKYKRTWLRVGGGTVSGTTNYIPKFTSSTAIGNSQIFDNGTNVGIGTASPGYKLEVNGSVYGNSVIGGELRAINGSDAGSQLSLWADGSGNTFLAGFNFSINTGNNNSRTNRFFISNTGDVGIGTASPAGRFVVADGQTLLGTNTNNGVDRLQVSGSALIDGGSSTATSIFNHTGTDGGINVRNTGTLAANRFSAISLLNGTTIAGASDRSFRIRNLGKTSTSSVLAFDYWDGSTWTERIRINEFGELGIGTDNPSAIYHANRNGTTTYSFVRLTNANSTANLVFGVGGSAVGITSLQNNAYMWNVANTAFILGNNDQERMRIATNGRILINTTSDNGLDQLQVNGSIQGTGFNQAYTARTTTYTAATTDYFIDCTTGTFTVNLFTAVGNTGRILIIKNSGTGTITVDPNGTQTIDGATTQTLSTQWSRVHIISDGANWKIISN